MKSRFRNGGQGRVPRFPNVSSEILASLPGFDTVPLVCTYRRASLCPSIGPGVADLHAPPDSRSPRFIQAPFISPISFPGFSQFFPIQPDPFLPFPFPYHLYPSINVQHQLTARPIRCNLSDRGWDENVLDSKGNGKEREKGREFG